MKPSFAIVGCGKIGTALGIFLAKAGYKAVGLAGRSLASAQRTAEIIGCDHYSDVPWEITRNADVVFITTPDGVIIETCDAIAGHKGFADKAVVLHCSGALPSTILSTAKTCGALTGSMHPLQTFASSKFSANPFQGITVSIEGENDAVNMAKKIVADLGGSSVTILTESKTLYHASAVVASNYLVALLDLALRLMGASGIAGRDAFKVLKPLIEGTLSNIEEVGIPAALTGPIVRGDAETVEKHIEEIGLTTPGLLDLYKTLGWYTIDIARAKTTLSETTVKQLQKLLGPSLG
jgi:predicted short-subunit dehydrogenase-like oxidoreductase (DUF2520 family)